MKNMHMNRFVLKSVFIKIYMSLFNKYFYKNKKSKLCFEDYMSPCETT
jgi:hypothetical protein